MKQPEGKIKIKKYWIQTPELFAEKYTNSTINLLSPANAFLYSRRKKVIQLAGNLRGKKVLDIGCGSGIFMIDFVKRGASVVGIDYSQKMLDLAKKQLEEHKVNYLKYKLIKAEATHLPFEKEKFDIVLATGLADYLSLKQNKLFVSEAARVLKENGIIICGFPSKISAFAFMRKGAGLWVRENIFNLPPIESNFSLSQIRSLLNSVSLKEVKHLKIFSTMWIVVAKHV